MTISFILDKFSEELFQNSKTLLVLLGIMKLMHMWLILGLALQPFSTLSVDSEIAALSLTILDTLITGGKLSVACLVTLEAT